MRGDKTKFGGLRVVWLETFVNVAEGAKRTNTAEDLGLNQGTVTKHIQQLEQWLGGKMLFHANVSTKLLPDGETFLPIAKEVLRLLDEARAPRTPPAPQYGPPNSPRNIKIPNL